MVTLWPLEIPIIEIIQNFGTWLEIPMRFFSFMGQEEFFLLVMSALYWCIDPSLGVNVSLALLLSTNINGYLKTLFHGSRPYWFSQSINPLGSETSFGFPSNHAQTATTVWGRLALEVRSHWAKSLFILIIFLIGFSRLYLGVHFISDVIGGWVIGSIVLFVIVKLEKPVGNFWFSRSLILQIALALIFSIISILIGYFMQMTKASWQIPANWITNALRVGNQEPIAPWDISGLFTISGLIFGMLAGVSLLRNQQGYKVSKNPGKLVICYFIGITGVLVFWYGLGLVFPRSEDLLGYAMRYFRYALVAFWIVYLAPIVFIRLKLGSKST